MFCRVRLLILDDANEVVYRIGFVVFDGIQESGEGLEDLVHVRVCGLSLDYDEGIVRLHKLCRYSLTASSWSWQQRASANFVIDN